MWQHTREIRSKAPRFGVKFCDLKAYAPCHHMKTHGEGKMDMDGGGTYLLGIWIPALSIGTRHARQLFPLEKHVCAT